MNGPEIVPELPAHRPAIRKLLIDAFMQVDEADLVDRLREAGGLSVSRVLLESGRICAYAAVSPMTACGHEPPVRLYALAPVAVAPDAQGRGLGSQVVRAVIAAMQDRDAAGLTVLGDPDYYGRFGFQAADRHGIAIKGTDFGPAFQVLPPGTSLLSPGSWRWHSAFDPLLE